MTTDEKDVDKVVLRAIAESIGSDQFDIWFQRQATLRVRDGRLEVLTSSRFQADRMASMFGDQLRAIAAGVLGEGSDVVFRVCAEEASQAAVTEEASAEPATRSAAGEIEPQPADALRANNASRRKRPSSFQSLSTFIVGSANRLAHTGVQTALERPGDFSPLVLWGPPGTGKTHLLQGIWTAVRWEGSRHVQLVTAEQFTTMFLQALHGRGLPSFRRKFRSVDVLLIDDLQFFAKKRATVVELQHTLDALLRDGKQVVVTADRAPSDLSGLGTELVTRLTGGLVCSIQLPDHSMRAKLVDQFWRDAEQRFATSGPGGEASPPQPGADRARLAELVAELIRGDARQLRGAVNQVLALSLSKGEPIDEALIRRALQGMVGRLSTNLQLPDIEKAVCEVFGLEPQVLQSDKRSKNVTHPRMLAMWLARKHTPAVYAEIGEYFGRRSHSTVIAAHRKVSHWMEAGDTIRIAGAEFDVAEAVRQVETRLRLA